MGDVVLVLFLLFIVFSPLLAVWLSMLGIIQPTEDQIMAFVVAWFLSMALIGSMGDNIKKKDDEN